MVHYFKLNQGYLRPVIQSSSNTAASGDPALGSPTASGSNHRGCAAAASPAAAARRGRRPRPDNLGDGAADLRPAGEDQHRRQGEGGRPREGEIHSVF